MLRHECVCRQVQGHLISLPDGYHGLQHSAELEIDGGEIGEDVLEFNAVQSLGVLVVWETYSTQIVKQVAAQRYSE